MAHGSFVTEVLIGGLGRPGGPRPLRRSRLLSVVGVLAALSGESVLVGHPSGTPLAVGGPGWGVLAPFLLIAPQTVLAGVATAFLPVFDPAHELAAAAPFPGLGLLLVRSLSALVAALVPVVAAAFVVPGPGWLPAALLLPCCVWAKWANWQTTDAELAAALGVTAQPSRRY